MKLIWWGGESGFYSTSINFCLVALQKRLAPSSVGVKTNPGALELAKKYLRIDWDKIQNVWSTPGTRKDLALFFCRICPAEGTDLMKCSDLTNKTRRPRLRQSREGETFMRNEPTAGTRNLTKSAKNAIRAACPKTHSEK